MTGDLFERRCAGHACEVVQLPGESVLRCPSGHRVYRWEIVEVRTGLVVGHAHWERGGALVDLHGAIPEIPENPERPSDAMPDRACKRGHHGSWRQRDDGRWRCRACERPTAAARWRAMHGGAQA